MTYLSTVFSFLRRVSAYFQNLTIQCLLTQVSTLELCFILFCITVGLMLRTLPTKSQPFLCVNFSTKMTQRSSSLLGLVRTHPMKIVSIVTSKNLASFSASDATVFMSFLETIVFLNYTINSSPSTFQYCSNITHFNTFSTSKNNHLRKSSLSSDTVSR